MIHFCFRQDKLKFTFRNCLSLVRMVIRVHSVFELGLNMYHRISGIRRSEFTNFADPYEQSSRQNFIQLTGCNFVQRTTNRSVQTGTHVDNLLEHILIFYWLFISHGLFESLITPYTSGVCSCRLFEDALLQLLHGIS